MNTSSEKIYFHFPYRPFTLKNRNLLKFFIETIFEKEKKKINKINFVFCANKSILKLNREHLNHNYPTDILTFCLSLNDAPIIADIYKIGRAHV